MSLNSMKIEPAKDSDYNNGSLLVEKKPEYPPCLTIKLRSEELKKLGFSEERRLPEIDERMMLTAMVEVVGVETENTDGMKEREVTLQIQEMKLEEKPAIKKAAEETLYGPQHR